MSAEPYPTIRFAYPAETVTVSDLWEVYPELAGDDKEEFAKQVRDAADFNRKHSALHLLRDRFDDAAFTAALEYAEDAGDDPVSTTTIIGATEGVK